MCHKSHAWLGVPKEWVKNRRVAKDCGCNSCLGNRSQCQNQFYKRLNNLVKQRFSVRAYEHKITGLKIVPYKQPSDNCIDVIKGNCLPLDTELIYNEKLNCYTLTGACHGSTNDIRINSD